MMIVCLSGKEEWSFIGPRPKRMDERRVRAFKKNKEKKWSKYEK